MEASANLVPPGLAAERLGLVGGPEFKTGDQPAEFFAMHASPVN